MNNLSSYCGLDDAKIRASDKDLPVQKVSCPVMHKFAVKTFWPKNGFLLIYHESPT